MNTRRPVYMLSLLLSGALTGCGDCVLVGVSAVTVNFTDSLSNAAPARATLVVSDGPYRDSVTANKLGDLLSLSAATEREGTYQVNVHADGYQMWTQSGVRASRRGGTCDYLRGARLNARMVRLQNALVGVR
ncbi:MAG: hypothetical protein ACO1Q7_13655 [Gemmatimonas sp.]